MKLYILLVNSRYLHFNPIFYSKFYYVFFSFKNMKLKKDV